ncbi:hypothetical protein [Paenibacillus puerhi]|uniref:hypothetical protein n=1 Tax=Paenibacillus puerhi TaxID=2692622 RepID=UPI00135B5B5F|nr:hypothetical protein [Paenibacillus puerhi]
MPHILAEHPYYKIVRTVTATEQSYIPEERVMCLFVSKITTRHREFPLHEVYDISYRRMGAEEGILYLHTRQGVYPFNVKSDPASFIEAFKRLAAE